jgi:hypothetical protein
LTLKARVNHRVNAIGESKMIIAAILYVDGKPVRVFKDDKCLYNAYRWAHKHFYLADEGFTLDKLPDWLEVKLHMLTEEQFQNLIVS